MCGAEQNDSFEICLNSAGERGNTFKIKSKTLFVTNIATYIFKEYLKKENSFEEFDFVKFDEK